LPCGCAPEIAVFEAWKNEPSIAPEKYNVETAFKQYSKGFQKVVSNVFSKEITAGETAMSDVLRANVTRFAAYKSFACNKIIEQDAQKPIDKRLGKEKWIKTFDYWQHTEEQMAAKRCRKAKTFDEAVKNGYQNMKWLPSISTEKRADHIPFYNQVYRIDDEVWEYQDFWGCKCGQMPTVRVETPHTYIDADG